MSRPRILVDADSCPVRVRKYLLSCTQKLKVQLIFAANRPLPCEGAGGNFTMQICSAQDQAADNWILQNAAEYDIIITRDIPLAAALLQKELRVMNDRGTLFTKDNIQRKLKERELTIQMSELGIGTKKRNGYSQKEFSEFTECFDRTIRELI